MNIEITGSIIISRDAKYVFNFISNLENDKLWRKEINFTEMSAAPQLNVTATESSYLSKRAPNNILNLICTAFTKDKQIVFKTLHNSDFFLESIRKVETVSANETRFNYSIKFSRNIVKHGLGFNLPCFIIRFAATSDMKKYLARLKAILEADTAEGVNTKIE